jgi:uncharacterized protein DUF3618
MNDISELERDVEEARDNLNRTLDAIGHKAAATSELLLPEQQIRRYPVPSLCGRWPSVWRWEASASRLC